MNDQANILAVDDSSELLAQLIEILSKEGYLVRPADSGVLALAAVNANPPDLIILEIRLKAGIDGLEVCRRLKANATTQHIPIILISGSACVEEWVEGLKLGAADFINKPFRSEELLARVRSHMNLSRANLALLKQAELLHHSLDQTKHSDQKLITALENQKLAENESSHFFSIVEKSLNEIYVCDAQTLQINYVNPGALVNLQYTLEAIKTMTAVDFKPEFTDKSYRVMIQPLLENEKELLIYETVHRRADGSRYPVEVRLQVIKTIEGQSVLLDVSFDISERKQAEEDKGKLQELLSQSQKMEPIGLLAGGIAHDFNNILAVILGYAEMARDDAQPGSQFTNYLDKVVIAAHRAKDLVKQILAFSRQSKIDLFPMCIQPLVKESLKFMRASIPTTITIEQNIHPMCGAILADPTQIHQIIMNLCTNAFHAMEETGGTLSLTMKQIAMEGDGMKPGNYVELTVGDTGTGIRPEIIDRIFDPYFTTKDVGQGTGMGLSITYGIVTSYGGTITVDSTIGQGTTFHVYIPVVPEEAKESEQQQEILRGNERILLVDDEKLVMEMGRDMLERLGYTVTAHNTSIAALENFMNDSHQFDLVIADQTMPVMTGIDLAQRILFIRPDIPIILCTGYSNLVNEESAKVLGVKGFAYKPLTKSSIGQLIRKVIGGGAASLAVEAAMCFDLQCM